MSGGGIPTLIYTAVFRCNLEKSVRFFVCFGVVGFVWGFFWGGRIKHIIQYSLEIDFREHYKSSTCKTKATKKQKKRM